MMKFAVEFIKSYSLDFEKIISIFNVESILELRTKTFGYFVIGFTMSSLMLVIDILFLNLPVDLIFGTWIDMACSKNVLEIINSKIGMKIG